MSVNSGLVRKIHQVDPSQLIPNSELIHTLPYEVFARILGYLCISEYYTAIQAFTLTSKQLKSMTIGYINERQTDALNSFFDFAKSKFKDPESIRAFFPNEPLACTSLRSLKENSFLIQRRILSDLLEDNGLNHGFKQGKEIVSLTPLFFETVEDFSGKVFCFSIENLVNRVLMPKRRQKYTFLGISRRLFHLYDEDGAIKAINKAIEIGRQESNFASHDPFFTHVAYCLIDIRQFEKLIGLINDERIGLSSSEVVLCFEHLIREQGIERAIEVAQLISNEWTKSSVLGEVVKALLANQNLERAIDVVLLISDEPTKSEGLRSVVRALLANQNFERAIEVAQLISNEWTKSSMLGEVVRGLLANQNIERAIDVVQLISDEPTKSEGLRSVVRALLANQNLERAIEVAQLISDESIKIRMLREVVSALITNQDFERAIALTGNLQDGRDRLVCYFKIFLGLCETLTQRIYSSFVDVWTFFRNLFGRA